MGAHVLYDVSINKDDSISKIVAQKSGITKINMKLIVIFRVTKVSTFFFIQKCNIKV